MALDRKGVMVRLSDDAYKALQLMAEIEDKDLGEKGRELLELLLLGVAHNAKIQAERFARALTSVNSRKVTDAATRPGTK
jgi:hypothetical protein